MDAGASTDDGLSSETSDDEAVPGSVVKLTS
jgi:hypothetical protein